MSYENDGQWLDRHRPDPRTLWMTLGVGALAGVVGYALWQSSGRNYVSHRPADSAPDRTSREWRLRDYAVTGRTVTIRKPRSEIYAFWRDFNNLPKFMENVRSASETGGETRWAIAGPLGQDVNVVTNIVEDREGEVIAWRSTDASEIETQGRVSFRDAPAGRGTEVEATIAYKPPAGEIGRWIAKLFQAEPAIQGRRELKRLKMLLEAGEIATNRNQKTSV
jgi:uncharacterized membrane protein